MATKTLINCVNNNNNQPAQKSGGVSITINQKSQISISAALPSTQTLTETPTQTTTPTTTTTTTTKMPLTTSTVLSPSSSSSISLGSHLLTTMPTSSSSALPSTGNSLLSDNHNIVKIQSSPMQTQRSLFKGDNQATITNKTTTNMDENFSKYNRNKNNNKTLIDINCDDEIEMQQQQQQQHQYDNANDNNYNNNTVVNWNNCHDNNHNQLSINIIGNEKLSTIMTATFTTTITTTATTPALTPITTKTTTTKLTSPTAMATPPTTQLFQSMLINNDDNEENAKEFPCDNNLPQFHYKYQIHHQHHNHHQQQQQTPNTIENSQNYEETLNNYKLYSNNDNDNNNNNNNQITERQQASQQEQQRPKQSQQSQQSLTTISMVESPQTKILPLTASTTTTTASWSSTSFSALASSASIAVAATASAFTSASASGSSNGIRCDIEMQQNNKNFILQSINNNGNNSYNNNNNNSKKINTNDKDKTQIYLNVRDESGQTSQAMYNDDGDSNKSNNQFNNDVNIDDDDHYLIHHTTHTTIHNNNYHYNDHYCHNNIVNNDDEHKIILYERAATQQNGQLINAEDQRKHSLEIFNSNSLFVQADDNSRNNSSSTSAVNGAAIASATTPIATTLQLILPNDNSSSVTLRSACESSKQLLRLNENKIENYNNNNNNNNKNKNNNNNDNNDIIDKNCNSNEEHVVKIQIQSNNDRVQQQQQQQQQQQAAISEKRISIVKIQNSQNVTTDEQRNPLKIIDKMVQKPMNGKVFMAKQQNLTLNDITATGMPINNTSATVTDNASASMTDLNGTATAAMTTTSNPNFMYYLMSSGQFSPSDTLDSGTGSDLESNGQSMQQQHQHHHNHQQKQLPYQQSPQQQQQQQKQNSLVNLPTAVNLLKKLNCNSKGKMDNMDNNNDVAISKAKLEIGIGNTRMAKMRLASQTTSSCTFTDSEESEASSLSSDSLHTHEFLRQCPVSSNPLSISKNHKLLGTYLPDSLLRDIRNGLKFQTHEYEAENEDDDDEDDEEAEADGDGDGDGVENGDGDADFDHNEENYKTNKKVLCGISNYKYIQTLNNTNNTNCDNLPEMVDTNASILKKKKHSSLPTKHFRFNMLENNEFEDTNGKSMSQKYDADKYYKFHLNERDNFQRCTSLNGGHSESIDCTDECESSAMRSLHDDAFAGYRDLRCGSTTSTIRSSKGTVRGVKNRVRNGIATFLQLQQSNVKNYKEKDSGKVVLYTTSMGIIRDTYAKCSNVKQILRTLLIKFEERDVFMSLEYQQEIKERMDSDIIKVPQLFVEGQYIGDAETVERLNESGELRQLLKPYKSIATAYTCQTCGGYRLLPCPSCNGSKKSVHRNHFTAEFVALKCMNCDEVGLVKCHNC